MDNRPPKNNNQISHLETGFQKLAEILRKQPDMVIAGHRNADGDCLGTMGAFYKLIVSLGGNVTLLTSDPVPENYMFLPGMEKVRVCESYDCHGQTLLLLECGTLGRSGISLSNCGETINLDHHPDNTHYGSINIVDSGASSIGEMVTGFFQSHFPSEISDKVADSLYVAIHTDTGGFSYGNTSSAALSAAAVLVGKGADAGKVCASVYQENRLARVRLMGHFLSGIHVDQTGNIATGIILLNDLEKYKCVPADTDNFSSYPRGIRGVKAGIFMMEVSPSVFKVSLRSKGEWSVNGTAMKMGGGGHRAAAGFVAKGRAEYLISEIMLKLKAENE
ncbi:MAG: hypothetical protein CO090_01710 [Acidobacteria bacterium CG_4_9_14_3_um_filter_49_7]|nr:MAG: hypothetical protein CO090_01710 [Acidobacteria bacterium CG_4_9_14_3_um_filter_49_7]